MYETILVPTDGSDPATQAAETGFKLAKQFGSTVHLLHIIEIGDFTSTGAYGGVRPALLDDNVMSDVESDAEKMLEHLETQANELGVDTVTGVRQGAAREEIISYADEHDIGLIVMGTHGRSGVERFLLGSVTERVVRMANIPVFVMGDSGQGEEER